MSSLNTCQVCGTSEDVTAYTEGRCFCKKHDIPQWVDCLYELYNNAGTKQVEVKDFLGKTIFCIDYEEFSADPRAMTLGELYGVILDMYEVELRDCGLMLF